MSEIILIVEDEQKISDLLADYLRASSFKVHQVAHAAEVIPWVKMNNPDLVLLDIMLPGGDGFSLCEQIRALGEIPVILLTARADEKDRLKGLESGADDYVCKPFSPKEVVARVKVVLRRYAMAKPASTTQNAQHSPFELDMTQMTATYQGRSLQLTAVEFAVLQLLASQPGSIFSREQLMRSMYPDNRVVSDRTIDSHIKKLRKKLAEIEPNSELIHSVYGVGYKLVVLD